jgi:PLP dependent protein
MGLADNLEMIRGRIAVACERVGRDPGSVTLVAVSKGQPPARVEALAALGQRVFGENRVQEAREKIPLCPARLSWHMIGHLQTNKCRDAVQGFELIESVDSLRLAVELDRWAQRLDRRVSVLLEVNVAGEATKFGYAPAGLAADLGKLLALRNLEVQGLMAMAPWSPDPERARPVFRRLCELRAECEDSGGCALPHLSMGMSGDFEVAIEEGATVVRIGTALFAG